MSLKGIMNKNSSLWVSVNLWMHPWKCKIFRLAWNFEKQNLMRKYEIEGKLYSDKFMFEQFTKKRSKQVCTISNLLPWIMAHDTMVNYNKLWLSNLDQSYHLQNNAFDCDITLVWSAPMTWKSFLRSFNSSVWFIFCVQLLKLAHKQCLEFEFFIKGDEHYKI